MAAPSLSSSSSTSASSHLFRDRAFRRCSSLPPLSAARSTQIPRFSASCSAAAERERAGSWNNNSYYYSRSYSCRGGVATASAAGTLYDVLGVAVGSTAQEIKAAYRRLARACHPDVVATKRKGASADEFMRIRAAYATLSDPDKRAEYDRRVLAVSATRQRAPVSWTSASYGSPPSPASPNSPSPSPRFSRRTWETDQCW